MSKRKSKWMQTTPYLLGGILFFIRAVRLLIREDVIGAVIFSITGVLAIFMFYRAAWRVALE